MSPSFRSITLQLQFVAAHPGSVPNETGDRRSPSGLAVVRFRPMASRPPNPPEDSDGVRADLAEVLARRAATRDEARPDAVERRHATGARTARENIADLVDPGSFVEYGRFITAAQESRRDLDELLDRTPADGLVAGLARIGGRACAVLSYDYLVMAGTQGMRGHRKSDRLIELIERMALPTVFFTEGGGGRPGDTDIPLVSALDVQSFALWARLSGIV